MVHILESMSTDPESGSQRRSTQPGVSIPLPPNIPNYDTDPDGFVRWAASPEGVEFFRLANMKLMEARVNAERARMERADRQAKAP